MIRKLLLPFALATAVVANPKDADAQIAFVPRSGYSSGGFGAAGHFVTPQYANIYNQQIYNPGFGGGFYGRPYGFNNGTAALVYGAGEIARGVAQARQARQLHQSYNFDTENQYYQSNRYEYENRISEAEAQRQRNVRNSRQEIKDKVRISEDGSYSYVLNYKGSNYHLVVARTREFKAPKIAGVKVGSFKKDPSKKYYLVPDESIGDFVSQTRVQQKAMSPCIVHQRNLCCN